MKILKLKTINIFVTAAMAITVFALPAFASTTDGTIDLTDKYAWSENIGWLNFGTTEGNVHITDSALTGYAWSENAGWISLNCSNNSSCATVDHKVANDGAGNLSGYAWSENTGWINFNPSGGGVIINSSGEFLGYAWGENIGWIVFNCATTSSCSTVDYKVKTDWRSQVSRPQCNNSLDDDGDGEIDYPNDSGCSSLTDDDETDQGGGGLSSSAFNSPTSPSPTADNPEGGFRIIINNNDETTNSNIVTLKLYAGSDTTRMSISNTEDFKNASIIPYQETIEWEIADCRDRALPCPYGEKTIYAKFYTRYGVPSETVSVSIDDQDNIPILRDGDLIQNPLAEGLEQFDVYIIKIINNKKYKRLILTPQIFESYSHFDKNQDNNPWNDIIMTDEQTIDTFTISNLIRCQDEQNNINDPKVYKLEPNNDTGIKRHLNLTVEQFTSKGYDWDEIFIINREERDWYKAGEEMR